MKDITNYIIEGMRGINRRTFRHWNSAPEPKKQEITINDISEAIYGYVSADNETLKLFDKEFNKTKSIAKAFDILKTDEDNFYRLFHRIGHKMDLENINDDEIEQYIKDHDKEISEKFQQVKNYYER